MGIDLALKQKVEHMVYYYGVKCCQGNSGPTRVEWLVKR